MAVDVDIAQFDTVEELDKWFKKQIAKADEADEGELRLQAAEARGSFYELQAAKANLAVAKRDALDKYPLAKEFAEDIKGSTPAEIEATAKRFHERMEKATADSTAAKQAAADKEAADKLAAQQGYGQPAAAGGGTPQPVQVGLQQALEQKIHGKLAMGSGMQDAGSKMEVSRWVPGRIAEAVDQSIRNPSYKSARPQSPDDKKIADDRTRRKG